MYLFYLFFFAYYFYEQCSWIDFIQKLFTVISKISFFIFLLH